MLCNELYACWLVVQHTVAVYWMRGITVQSTHLDTPHLATDRTFNAAGSSR